MASQDSASKAWKIFVGVLVGLLLILLIAEFGLRWYMGRQMTSQFMETTQAEGLEVTEKPSVSFGASPLTLGMLGGKISQMNMSTPSTLQIEGTEVKGQPAADIELRDLSVASAPVAGQMRATTTLPDDFLLATFQKSIAEQSDNATLGNMVITSITTNAEDSTIDVEFGGGLASLALEPSANNGVLDIATRKAAVFGMNLPDQATAALSDSLREGVQEQFVGSQLHVDAVEVGSGELKLTVAGTNVPLKELSSAVSTAPGETNAA